MNEYRETLEVKQELTGTGGWLVFFQVWMYLFILMLINWIILSLAFISETTLLSDILIPAISVCLLSLAVTCMVNFYKRRLIFRKLYIIFWVAIIIFVIISAIIKQEKIEVLSAAVFMGSGTAVAIALKESNRVRNTFM